MVNHIPGASPSPDTPQSQRSVKIPASFQKAGFNEADYKKFEAQMLSMVQRDMDKLLKKQLETLKKQRRQIETGEVE